MFTKSLNLGNGRRFCIIKGVEQDQNISYANVAYFPNKQHFFGPTFAWALNKEDYWKDKDGLLGKIGFKKTNGKQYKITSFYCYRLSISWYYGWR